MKDALKITAWLVGCMLLLAVFVAGGCFERMEHARQVQDVRVVDMVEPHVHGGKVADSKGLAEQKAAKNTDSCTCGAPACPCAGPLEPPGDDPQPTPALAIVGPAEVAPGTLVKLTANTVTTARGWVWLSFRLDAPPAPDTKLHELADANQTLFFSSPQPGWYVFALMIPSTPDALCAVHYLHVTGPSPIPPKPPEPGPTPPPVPPQPTPGLIRVLIIEETGERTPAIANVLHSQKLLAYLNSHCSKTGNTPDWRILDQDTDVSRLGQHWVNAMRSPRSGLPWIVICNGTQCQGAPLPKTVDETLALLAKWGGS